MDKTVLVGGVDFEKGAEILRILDDARLKISVALWVYLPEYEDWRMVLSSRKFDSISLPKAYGLLHNALNAASVPLEKTPPIMIMALSDPFIRVSGGFSERLRASTECALVDKQSETAL